MYLGNKTNQSHNYLFCYLVAHFRYGWTPKEDLENIGQRFLEPLPDGPFKGFSVTRFLPDLVYDFYRECGWDEKTGEPTPSTLERLDLKDYIKAAE
jgi:aldehyde:ferredoxin oxidoreductase